MTHTRTDDELEQLLRSTLTSHAATVPTGPHWSGTPVARSHSRWIAPLIAAALVLGLVATFVVLRVRATDTAPARPPSPEATTDLTSFRVPGYPVAGTLFAPGYRAVAVRTPGGVISKAKADAVVFDYGARGYDFRGFRSQAQITVDGHPGYRGTAPAIPNNDRHRVPTIVWNYVPGRWAVVQSVEGQRAPTTATLLRLAGAAQPTWHLPIATAFRFTGVPAGFHVVQSETLSYLRATVISLHNARGATLTVTSAPVNSKLAQGLVATDVISHGDLLLAVDPSEPNAPATRADKVAAAQLRAQLVWQQSTLGHVVP